MIWADSKYHNHKLLEWVNGDTGRRWSLTVVKRPEGTKGFVLLAKRWVVERTHAWIGRCRRHSRDYERYTSSSAAMIQMTSIGTMFRRLSPSPYAVSSNTEMSHRTENTREIFTDRLWSASINPNTRRF